MKYVRTEDGRIAEVKDNMTIKSNRLVYKDRPCIAVLQGCDEIIAQADTLEELCDEFVQTQQCWGDEIKYWILPKLVGKSIETVMKGIKDHLKDGNIYGAIWTSKGLIYVAKMNDKGELVLI